MNNNEKFSIEESPTLVGAKIKAIGVGGGGGNMINHMINSGITDIDLIVANTDAQALETSNAPYKIQLGEKLTKGLGAGMKPEIGQQSAIESYDAIKEVLDGADIVFVSSGLGGGTGTGAAPVIAQAAKEIGALTVSVVTKPFRFEGKRRQKLAETGLEELKRESDSIIVIPNEKLLSIVDKNLGIKDSFKMVDNILARAVSGISNVILSRGKNDINLDFADVNTVMSHRGLALMGVGEATGPSAAYEAIKNAIESPLLDNMDIKGAMGVLVHFQIHPDYPILEISEAMSVVEDNADENAHVIFGTTTDEAMQPDEVKITIVATGFETENSDENEESKKESPKQQITLVKPEINEESIPASTPRVKVVGGYDNEEILDIPTWMRNQMD
ncbi:cell division protein FtsZ [Hydrogenimonas thermophila]|uniref:Cell division protein FtsZ n=1 Tax=Hydrogenimonas thermophila TaxID=223786 RepID=A0A1I5QMS3_9BACT|nr:cell division protein FtsZ [Hydrogenimonas thermophila]WOE71153.1 cell division protein FtsZ [Hydrogenimonas thermophila]WOE73671.1 cell division protein FtsZ [Hydrogenimonas thermophila]SFP47618.1 cell division protein FtsZ [Hydrogenimonas thermophila]